jgi:hypothetical protein
MQITTTKTVEQILTVIEADVKSELEKEINKVLDEHYKQVKGQIAQRIMNECVLRSNLILDACSSVPEFRVSLTFNDKK